MSAKPARNKLWELATLKAQLTRLHDQLARLQALTAEAQARERRLRGTLEAIAASTEDEETRKQIANTFLTTPKIR